MDSSAQEMSHLLLRVYLAPNDGDAKELFSELMADIDQVTFEVCQAWAHEQYQLVKEQKGRYLPSTVHAPES